jgi:hypothetical protein
VTVQEAHDALADIIWWFKGFKAAQPEDGFQAADADHMIANARGVQDFANKFRAGENKKEPA